MKKTYSILIFLFATTIVLGQSSLTKVDGYLDSLTRNDKFSGYVLIARKGKTIFGKGYGYADRGNGYPNISSTQFCLSSTSKLFTGTIVVKLMQEGKIKAEDTIGTYVKGLAYGNRVTIHHLLTHSSGLRDFYEDPMFSYKEVKNCSDVVKYIRNQKLSFNPGEKVKYSTSGMILLGAVVEKVSGVGFQEYLMKELFIPLGMKNTSFKNYSYVQYEKLEPSSYSIGYIKDSTGNIIVRRKPWDKIPEVALSAGGIWSSAEDLLIFDNAIHKGKILNKKYLKILLESKVATEWPDIDFGYVWLNINRNKPTHAVGHAGNAGGHHNTFFRYDINDTTIIVLTNFGFADVFQISSVIEKQMFGEKVVSK